MKPGERLSILAASVLLVWLNVYLCREAFLLDDFGQMQSMHGFWTGLARLASFDWTPQWWRYSYNGMPFEYAYSPGVPALIRATADVTGWSFSRAFGAVAGFVFCLGPLALYWLGAEITRRPWWSFVAALGYSLLTPSHLFAPDQDRTWYSLGDTRRILLIFAWDEVPHQLALAILLLATLCLIRGLSGNRLYFWVAGLFLSLAMFTSPFGGTVGAMLLALVWLSWPDGGRLRSLAWLAGCGVSAYLVVSPFSPPSLIRVIRRNANLSSASEWTATSAATLVLVAAAVLALAFLARRWSWHLRFLMLASFVFAAIPFLGRWDLHFVPQSLRYKIELDAMLVLLVTFAIAHRLERTPKRWRVAAALLLVIPVVSQVKTHRRYAKKILVPSDHRQTIEFRVASWLATNAPDQRVMAPGSTGQWMNAFTAQEQFLGGSFPTTPSVVMQAAHWGIPHLKPRTGLPEAAKVWLQAYGVDALVVPGPRSPEYWRPFEDPAQFAELFPLLWREDDTSIYSVPRAHRSLAAAVAEESLVRKPPGNFFDLGEIGAYAKALDEPEAGLAWTWVDRNTALVRGIVPRGHVVSTHITYHPGWNATVSGAPRPTAGDGLAQLTVRPDCDGPCEIRLEYDGGVEAKVTRAASGITLAAAMAAAVWLARRRRVAA